MRLMLAYPPKFTNAKLVSDSIKGYFPKFITGQHLVESQGLVRYFKAEEIDQIAESLLLPNWETDIVFVALSGPIYAYEEFRIENCGATFQQFQLGAERSLPKIPKFGGYFNLPTIARLGLMEDAKFLSKLAAEELLHTFAVPKGHDPLCFFHPREVLSAASHRYEYCAKCLNFMAGLAEPLNYQEIYRLIDQLYASA